MSWFRRKQANAKMVKPCRDCIHITPFGNKCTKGLQARQDPVSGSMGYSQAPYCWELRKAGKECRYFKQRTDNR